MDNIPPPLELLLPPPPWAKMLEEYREDVGGTRSCCIWKHQEERCGQVKEGGEGENT